MSLFGTDIFGTDTFGTDIFPYSTSFVKLHLRTTFNISFPNKQHIIFVTLGYSVKLMVNVVSLLTYFVLRALPQNYLRITPYLKFIYNKIII